MHDEFSRERGRAFIWVGIALSFFIGLLFGVVALIVFQSERAGCAVWIAGFLFSLDVCFRGRNG